MLLASALTATVVAVAGGGASTAHADYQCAISDYKVLYTYPDGSIELQGWCYGDPPSAPTPAPPPPPAPAPAPPSSGGTGGSGGGAAPGGGSGGGQQAGPATPTFQDILLFMGCQTGTGDPEFARELDELTGNDGSARVVGLVDGCVLDYLEEQGVNELLGRPATNWELAILNPDLNITPNQAQTDALNIYLKTTWDAANAPATTAAPATTTTEASATSQPVTDTAPQDTVADTVNEVASPEPVVPIADTVDSDDSSNIVVWILAVALAAAGIVVAVIVRRRRTDNTDPET